MKLCTIRLDRSTTAAVLRGEELVEIEARDVGELLADAGWRQRAESADGARHRLDEASYAPLIPRPPKIICVGLNYATHIAEMGREVPAHPTFFAKFPNSLIGAHDPIQLPRVSTSVDWEVELGVVIGSPARHVSRDDALDHVAGYTVVNDISVRDYQRRTLQFLQGKTFEATTPVGPWLVTSDELPAGGAGLPVQCEVDGEVMQASTTSDLLFDVATLVSYFSEIATLEPGDLIATGTPDGVGAGRTPPVFLRDGQVVRTTIEGVGELVNRCEGPPPAG
ncbi:MAG: fumarylacetoacetate hydrolase family protein [Acidimicrobiia bacterium]|nr:fumarylacetoacetate hydrolase family protein [Acidimicrobiia bacterium]